ncbi:hypothetical protein [Halosolutus gelatinilyticus]|uniref:hypothetical protein n=1 Tax=Halosolutus gelatinilyticus TaxID=2931975 RepID=UPI001FF17383|nr:hypothetical protein [Halosolutus gelatinilyticus]
MNDAVRALAAVLLLCSLPIAATIGVGATASTGSDSGAAIATANATERDGETVRHRHPDEYEGESDADQLEAWLSNRLLERLRNSTRALNEGEYELAREYLGEEYRERYEQYVEVAGESDDGSRGDGDAAVFDETASEQARLVDLVETYNETTAEYERAREAGEEDRARDLARELEALAAEIEATGGTVVTNYEIIAAKSGANSSEAGTNASDSAAAVEESVSNVRRLQAVVRTEQFVETELVLDAEAETGSFSDPIRIRGELQTADDSIVANETVRLEIDGHPIDVRTDADGALDFEYRPTTQRLSETTVTVEYVPEAHSAYLGSETAVNASIEQVEPTIADLETTGAIGYNESLSVEGTLSVDGVPVDDVRLEVAVGDVTIGTVAVTDGAFADSIRLPAALPAGDRSLTVAFPHDDRALAATSAATSVSVVETETDLRLDVTPIDDDEFRVEGRLATIDGQDVPNQSIAVEVDGARAGPVATGPNGEFSERVTAAAAIDDEATVVAVYDDPETNLAAAETEATVRPPGSGGSLLAGALSAVSPSTLLVGAIGLAGVGAAVWWRHRGSRGVGSTRAPSAEAGAGTASAASAAESGTPETALVDALFDRAREHLSDGRPERAVRTCYAAVRQACAPDSIGTGTLTHWEFYRQFDPADADVAAERGVDDAAATAVGDRDEDVARDRDRLRAITETYERAVFAPESVSRREAARLLDVARSLCDDEAASPPTESETPIADD